MNEGMKREGVQCLVLNKTQSFLLAVHLAAAQCACKAFPYVTGSQLIATGGIGHAF